MLFEPLFPRWPHAEIPIGHVTNGVHMPSWDSAAADKLWTAACGKNRWLGTAEMVEQDIRCVSGVSLWKLRNELRVTLVEYARDRLSKQLTASGASPEAIERAKHLFDPNILTLGFARRFAPYKRPDLLLQNRALSVAPFGQSRPPGTTHHRRQGPSGTTWQAKPSSRNGYNSSGGPRYARM